ncbi:MAG TPA: hypothetical protein VLS53_05495, partial [Candidatus Dormibacteraeota bacterium]|nr:hypothetical protein [Candidatus Dormibacteraeota bacterium]
PIRPVDRNAGRAMTWGVVALIFFWMPLIAIPTGILSIIFAGNGLRAIRSEPQRLQGEDRARTGRVLGIIGLAISSVLLALFLLALLFRTG